MSGETLPTIAVGLFVCFVFALGASCGFGVGVRFMRTQAIEHGSAQFNPRTSEFEWIER